MSVGDFEYGTITTDKDKAYTNDTVTVTATAKQYYVLKNIIVTGKCTGNTVEVTVDEDGTYIFAMPAEPVTITAAVVFEHRPFVAWCEGNNTLYFSASADTPAVGDTYDGQTVTRVWNEDELTNWEGYPGWIDGYAITGDVKKVVFDESFAIVRPTNCSGWFMRMTNLTEIVGLNYLNTGKATKMDNMFQYCRSLTEIDVTGFDTRKVTSTANMFVGCSALATLNVNNFDMSNVEYANQMFYNCSSLKTIYCAKTWEIANTGYMFYGCTSLVGAAKFDSEKIDGAMANPDTGYFTGSIPMTLAEALQQEDGTTCRISDDLVVVKAAGKHYYVKSATDNAWARLDLNTTEPIVEGNTLKDVKATLANRLTAPTFTVSSCSLETTDIEIQLQEIDLAYDFEMPQPSEVVKFTGYYYDGHLRGFHATGHKGQSITLDTEFIGDVDFAEGDRYTAVVGIEVKEPWRTSAGAPRRANSSYDYDFQNLIGKVLEVNGHSIITGIEEVNAAGSDNEIRYYDTSGRYIGTTLDNAPQGIYITSDGRKVRK